LRAAQTFIAGFETLAAGAFEIAIEIVCLTAINGTGSPSFAGPEIHFHPSHN
jgi:hypothetical protein